MRLHCYQGHLRKLLFECLEYDYLQQMEIRFVIFDAICSFEKYIGGKYLGELVRLVLCDLYEKELVLTNTPEERFPEPWTFDTSYISDIEEYVCILLSFSFSHASQ